MEPVSIRLTVNVTGIRGSRGSIVVSLFHGGDGFPGDSKKALASHIVPLTDASATSIQTCLLVVFEGLAPGEYAVALFHDENDNGKLDEHWGIPNEGFGFSNNPKIRWGAPRYGETKFALSVSEREAKIAVSLKYLRGSHH